jgi:hypothetical protein
MKKVKVILTALVVLTVVGGALAFKAKKSTKILYYPDLSGVCNQPVTKVTFGTSGASFWVTDVPNTPCISTSTVFIND